MLQTITAYEESKKNETPILLSVVCSLLPKAIFLTFIINRITKSKEVRVVSLLEYKSSYKILTPLKITNWSVITFVVFFFLIWEKFYCNKYASQEKIYIKKKMIVPPSPI